MSRPPPSDSMIVAASRADASRASNDGLGRLLLTSRTRGVLARLGCAPRAGATIDVHEAGLVRRDRDGELALAWVDVAAVFEGLDEADTPIGTRLEPKVVLESFAGRRIVIDRSIARHVDIARIAAARAQEAMLTRIETTFAFGRRIELGPIAVDGFGLHPPDGSHAWAAIAFVRWERLVYRGSFSIHLLDGTIGARVPSEYVANPRVLLTLLERQGKLERPREELIAGVLGAA